MLNRVKAVIFDLDGTIVDSMWIWEQIDIDFLAKRGIRLPNDLQKAIEGMSFTETAIYFKNRFNLKESIEEIKEEWNAMAYDFYKNRVPLKKGVNEFIKYLKQKNIKLGIGTSNSRELAIEVLKTHNILHYFDTIRTSCEVEKGKPYPDVFLKVAEDLKVSPEDCLVFEDTYAGVLAAKRAGMKVFAVADEFSFPYKDEICSLADKYIENFREIA
ncbi:HAD family hydrolase [Caloranaerobacter azorensis H53214]|uniref:Haloacid dehalogenase superfamily, subfamily IA, variant 3 with third motif having DD or ED/haloacid dehalogenase superfamily, subfamily IA, variant 1 with third motif having Dx(3-4)D or Dx(3-4)E n=2 Tax=Caloranaerobacter azorensis TaxID=116090 RepID=A0A1M5SNQ5_9FIRM|nr:HAD family phosphatase [Caloranaerobacter azorensis]KGG81324.1 HAD family hydrolase [Caloranaerobacter azorensis H53214]SHH39918.1 haloacid dehalogenase superfamily, subfamily IA, variant 3 with third motif having DD or ED/haloacid dehalogenase superfamily, subfamily IA, variant 1 with third motif having Dx(3-4)D or Dx(3-4)E [Caloranaerobacter azorensis DSM 13643]